MAADLFVGVGGLSAAYAGFEGLEDDTCRRVAARLGLPDARALVRAPPGSGGFGRAGGEGGGGEGQQQQQAEAVVEELAARFRAANARTLLEKWRSGDGANTNSSSSSEAGDASRPPLRAGGGLEGVPLDWPRLLRVVKRGEGYVVWEARLPPPMPV